LQALRIEENENFPGLPLMAYISDSYLISVSSLENGQQLEHLGRFPMRNPH
jgi:hypothetical protein